MQKYFLFLFLSSISFAQLKTVESKVVEATVFRDRAMVTRSAEVNLKKGENQIVFSNLTTDVKDETVRISTEGSGEIKILDVKVERKFTPEIRKENVNDLQKKIDSLKEQVKAADDQIAMYESKKAFVESLKAESVKYANLKILLTTNSPKEWNELLKFVETNLDEIYKNIRKQNSIKSGLTNQINALQLTINNYQGGEQKNYKEIIVKLDASQKTNAEIKASYIVNSASWYPVYDVRVDTKTKQAEFSFFGMILQTTGEDWEDVKLTFSTANPLSMKSLPQLNTWYLDVIPVPYKQNLHGSTNNSQFMAGGYTAEYSQNSGLPNGTGAITGYITDQETGEPLIGANVLLEGINQGSTTDVNGRYYIPNVPVRNYNMRISYIGYAAVNLNIKITEKNTASLNIPLEPDAITMNMNEVVVTGKRPPIQKSMTNSVNVILSDQINLPVYSDVKSNDLSTNFELNTKNTIPSDNSPHKVTIGMNVLPVEFSYTSIPKILPKVYLKGKIVNKNDYPFLEGEMNIFVDNDFVNRTSIKNVVPNDTMELALGIDESISCEKHLKNRFVESKGLFGGKKKVNYDFEIKVVNNRTSKVKISVIDQLPVSRNEDIKTELVEPETKDVEINAERQITWKLQLGPGETKILPLKFYVEFPGDVQIYGLE